MAVGLCCPHCGERAPRGAWRHQDPSRALTCAACGGKSWLRVPSGMVSLGALAGLALDVYFFRDAGLAYPWRLAAVLATAVAFGAAGIWIAWRHGTLVAITGSAPVRGPSLPPPSTVE